MRTHVLHSVPDAGLPASFRACLQEELARRCARNARYSLRAFANFLQIDHATLSQLLRGKRAMSAATVRRLGARIGLSAAAIDGYVARAGSVPESAQRQRSELAAEAVRVVGAWYPAAILELMRLRDFRPDARWIARMLSIDVDEVQLALQQLTRLGFLRMTAADRWDDLTGGVLHGEEEFTLHALETLAARSRTLQLSSAQGAAAAPRHHSSTTVAVRSARAASLVARVAQLLEQIGDYADDGPADRLYRVELHCFPLVEKSKEETQHGKSGDPVADRDAGA